MSLQKERAALMQQTPSLVHQFGTRGCSCRHLQGSSSILHFMGCTSVHVHTYNWTMLGVYGLYLGLAKTVYMFTLYMTTFYLPAKNTVHQCFFFGDV